MVIAGFVSQYKFLLLPITVSDFLLGNNSAMIAFCFSRFLELPREEGVILLGQLGFLSGETGK